MHGLQQLQLSGSAVVEPGLSGSTACGVLIPQPGIEPASPAPAGGFLTPGPSEKSPLYILSEMTSLSFGDTPLLLGDHCAGCPCLDL